MGILLPDDFPLASLKNDAERMVVEALRDRLSDGWVVMPAVGMSGDDRDYEIDVVIAHERDGIAVIEVKGHRPKIMDGQWYSGRDLMQPQPIAQARDNAYELRRRLRRVHPSLANVGVEYAVAFPNVSSITGHLPPDVHRTQVLTCDDLEDPMNAVDHLMTRRWTGAVGEVGVQAVVDLLRPSAELRWEPEARARLARLRLDTICHQQVQALEPLDVNRRVCVTGAAGTGKTRLAIAWVRRAQLRGERVLFTCFNIPLAAMLRSRLNADDDLVVGPFHEVALALEGMPPLEVPDDADADWWDQVELGHLHTNWHRISERFDTIVVDEAQDFRPAWLTLLTQLLAEDRPRRLLLVGDESQGIYERGFNRPDSDDGWTLCELPANCRNTFQIASLLQRRFHGALAPVGGPESEDLQIREIDMGEVDLVVDEVGDALDEILDDRDHAAPSVFVGTFTRSIRDRLRTDLGFVAFEELSPLAVLCETVHRAKGLEYDHVILVVHDIDVSDELLYVGASRAVMSLTVIGPPGITSRLTTETS